MVLACECAGGVVVIRGSVSPPFFLSFGGLQVRFFFGWLRVCVYLVRFHVF
jgi:hypothetical protein